ncbi:putative GPI biosynthesis protein Pig-F [Helianthus annuus]|nr:putative GPI biosynthesis protein Pig-F [Helianthus annuus]
MSAFTFAPAASVYGSSWVDWHRIFANTKLIESIDYMICMPAYGAVIGAWFGAWPMPLDWERTQITSFIGFIPEIGINGVVCVRIIIRGFHSIAILVMILVYTPGVLCLYRRQLGTSATSIL